MTSDSIGELALLLVVVALIWLGVRGAVNASPSQPNRRTPLPSKAPLVGAASSVIGFRNPANGYVEEIGTPWIPLGKRPRAGHWRARKPDQRYCPRAA